jgi:hypothetical protein
MARSASRSSLRVVGIALAALTGLFAIVVVASVALIESEEVVVIETRDADDEIHRARIWVVDHLGSPWVAPGNRSNGWFQRLLVTPRVVLIREGRRSCYLAVVVRDEKSLPILELFLEKYASVIRVTSLLNFILEPGGDSDAEIFSVRLDPC